MGWHGLCLYALLDVGKGDSMRRAARFASDGALTYEPAIRVDRSRPLATMLARLVAVVGVAVCLLVLAAFAAPRADACTHKGRRTRRAGNSLGWHLRWGAKQGFREGSG